MTKILIAEDDMMSRRLLERMLALMEQAITEGVEILAGEALAGRGVGRNVRDAAHRSSGERLTKRNAAGRQSAAGHLDVAVDPELRPLARGGAAVARRGRGSTT